MQKILPPFLFIACFFFMILSKIIFPNPVFIYAPYNFLGVILIIIPLWNIRALIKKFAKQDSELHTFKKPKKLIQDGQFKISRNPIYLSFLLALFGLALSLGNVYSLVGGLVFFLVANFWYIPTEEKNLLQKFGNEYEEYCSQVRRWI